MSPAAAASVLQWWADAGVDVLVDDSPRDWLRPQARAAAAAPVAEPRSDSLPDRLDLFEAWLAESATLPYASPSAPRVGPSGNAEAGLMILTDMPTAEDGEAGTLLSGEAGRLFDRMMAAIGRDRSSLYLASLSSLRSPDGRFTARTAAECAVLARHQVGLARPRALLLFGDACSKALLGRPMAQARGAWHELDTPHGPVRTLVTIPPSYLLDQPSAKALAWADLQRLAEGLSQ